MTDYEVAQRLGYDLCVCGKIDGTWHPECYRGKTQWQIAAGYRQAFAAARRHLKGKTEPDSKTRVGCPECAWGKVAGCWRCGSR